MSHCEQLSGEVRGQQAVILGRHSATYTADVLGCTLTVSTLSGSVFIGEIASRVCRLPDILLPLVGVLPSPLLCLLLLLCLSIPPNTWEQFV